MNRTLVLFSLISSLAGILAAEQIQLSGPVEGFTFDAPTGSFLPVLGFPGSASFGPAILDGFAQGSVAPQQKHGLAFKDGKWLVVTGLGSASASLAPLPGAQSDAQGVAWSGDGSRAFLFSRSGAWMQTVAGLPDEATAGTPVDLSILPGTLSAIAADTGGKRIAIGVTGESGGVYLITDGGVPVPVLAGSKPIALAFSDDGSELYAIDGAALQLRVLQIASSISDSFALDGILDPIAVQSTRDSNGRRLLLVAGRDDYLLRIWDESSRQIVTDIALDARPSELEDFGRNSFLLGPRRSGKDPLWLLTTTPRQAVYFVPAAPAASGGPQ